MENNFAIGVDIENISRFKKLNLIKDVCLLNKIFTAKEIEYCLSKNDPAPHLAVRFAGKEAVLKALSNIKKSKISILDYKKIEISNKENNRPVVSLNDLASGDITVKISLSHCQDKVIAFALLASNKFNPQESFKNHHR